MSRPASRASRRWPGNDPPRVSRVLRSSWQYVRGRRGGSVFVGQSRQAEVDRLLARFASVSEHREPALVVYVAPPGWGKTRIVQEFYRRLAAGQPAPAYWPRSLVPDSGELASTMIELTASRKTVRHREAFAVPSGARIPWLWLAPPSGRLSDGSPAPALEGLIEQLRVHARVLLGPNGLSVTSRADAADLRRRMEDGLRPGQGQEWGRLLGTLSAMLIVAGDGVPVPAVLVLDDAHDLDAVTTNLVSDLMASDLPVLVVATTWPDRLAARSAHAPFPDYLREAETASAITQVHLGSLAGDDLVDYLLDRFPATDPYVAQRLAGRADGNPYVLRLLLNTPRLQARVRRGALVLATSEIDDLSGRLDRLLDEHWEQLAVGVRQVLVCAAIIGHTLVDEVLIGGLRQVSTAAGVDAAVNSSWIRPLGGVGHVLEFVERLRFEVARADAPNVLSLEEREEVLRGALRAVRLMLPAEPEGVGRLVLLAIHVALAKDGTEDDLPAAAGSALELADRARSEHRRLDALEYLTLAVDWFEQAKPTPWSDLVSALLARSSVQRIEYGRLESEPVAEQAFALAQEHLSAEDELQVKVRTGLARARRRREDGAAYASCKRLFNEAEGILARLRAPSEGTRRDVWALRASLLGHDGDYQAAADECRELAIFCESTFGQVHRHTLEAMSDLGYYLQRFAPEEALPVRREVLARRIYRFGDPDHPQTGGAKNDLAFCLLEVGGPDALAEAESLVDSALRSRARAFGLDASKTNNIRLVRSKLWRELGLLAEADGDESRARDLFTQSAAETARVVELRANKGPASRAKALQRHGESLACLRDSSAIAVLDDALRIREVELRQDATFVWVRDCARSLSWSYQRLGRTTEAAAVIRRYQLDGDA